MVLQSIGHDSDWTTTNATSISSHVDHSPLAPWSCALHLVLGPRKLTCVDGMIQAPLTTGFQQLRGTEDGRRKACWLIPLFLPVLLSLRHLLPSSICWGSVGWFLPPSQFPPGSSPSIPPLWLSCPWRGNGYPVWLPPSGCLSILCVCPEGVPLLKSLLWNCLRWSQLPAGTMGDTLHPSSFQTGKTYETERRDGENSWGRDQAVWFLKTRLNWIID